MILQAVDEFIHEYGPMGFKDSDDGDNFQSGQEASLGEDLEWGMIFWDEGSNFNTFERVLEEEEEILDEVLEVLAGEVDNEVGVEGFLRELREECVDLGGIFKDFKSGQEIGVSWGIVDKKMLPLGVLEELWEFEEVFCSDIEV